MPRFVRNLWVLVTPAPDLPNQWIGHCLDLDIVSVGVSIAHALEMTVEAVGMSVADDLERGRDPFTRAKAPEENWRMLNQVTSCGTFGTPPADGKVIAATQFRLVINDTSHVERMPPAWMIEAFNRDSEMRV